MPDRPQHADFRGADRCGNCRWWQSDHRASSEEDHVGLCLHEELAHFQLQVSDDSGCNRFEPAVLAAPIWHHPISPGP
jgi:hypothetical protein